MYATLGNIEFELHTSPAAEGDTLEITYASHELINQPSQLQPTGRSLVEKELEIILRADFCKVEETIKKITDAALNYDAMALVYGNGKYEGDYVIKTIGKKTNQRDGLGNLLSVTLSLTLSEYVTDKLQNEQKKAEKKAFATGKKKGVTGKSNGTATASESCKTSVSRYSSQMNTYKGKENTDFSFYLQSTEASIKQNMQFSIRSHISVVKNLSESMVSLHSGCLQQYSIDFPVDQLISTCQSYNAAMLGTNELSKKQQHGLFQSWLAKIVNGSTAANAQTITRR